MQRTSTALIIAWVLLFSVGGPAIQNAAAQESDVAASAPTAGNPAFVVPPSLRGRVDFWVRIFSKYGKQQLVFHDREDPKIVYSALDFSEYAEDLSPAAFERKKGEAVDAETARIRSGLLRLAEGSPPRNAFERRVERMFESREASTRREAYREAADPERIRTQTGIKERFREGLERSSRYLHAIERVFRERGLPVELAKLPLVESSFDYNAYSSVGAAGIWQFMRSTGKRYMRVDATIDERRDPIVATRAAADYLAHAYETLGKWPLAVTSYNHGINGILRGVKEVGSDDLYVLIKRYQGQSWGFASKNFFPELLAALEVYRNWHSYFPDLIFEAPVYFDEVRLGQSVGYRQLVKLSGISEESFRELNPALREAITKSRFPVPQGTLVKVPSGRGSAVLNAVKGSSIYSSVRPQPAPKQINKAAAKRKKAASGGSSITKGHAARKTR